MRRLALLVVALAACAALPAAAQAGGSLTVHKNVAKAGTVTAGGEIDCGLTCASASHFFANECDGEGICTPPDVGVSATPQPGWSAVLEQDVERTVVYEDPLRGHGERIAIHLGERFGIDRPEVRAMTPDVRELASHGADAVVVVGRDLARAP